MKWIACSQRVQIVSSYGERRDALSQEWTEVARVCGFLPLLLPNCRSVAEEMLASLPPDGILLTGGNDLEPYGGDAPERDEMEHMLVQYAIDHRIPLLGVCRGAQLLMEHFGTPLEKVEGHIRVEHLLNNGDRVNSFHSWGTKACEPPLQAVCCSEDGVVEEIRHQDYPWIHGILWHPERYSPLRGTDVQRIKEVFGL